MSTPERTSVPQKSSGITPRALFRQVAIIEACTWTALLVGMFLKYVTETTDQVVSIAGMAHGVAFIGYCGVTVLVAVDQRWSLGRTALGLGSAIPPLATLWFDRHVEKHDAVGDVWRLGTDTGSNVLEKVASLGIRRPVQGMFAGIIGIALLTAVALAVGPPV